VPNILPKYWLIQFGPRGTMWVVTGRRMFLQMVKDFDNCGMGAGPMNGVV